MHLIVYFVEKNEIKVVLPEKYANYEMVAQFREFYDR